jgi:protein phosphatase
MYYAAQASPPQAITYALDFANAWLHYWGRMPGYRGMGAAVVAAVMCDGELIVAHVGDCRAYLARGGAAWPLTRDHTWGTEAVASGMLSPTEATRHPYANVLTRSLGARPALGAEARRVLIAPGDRVVLCSDGVTRTAGDAGVAWAIGQRNTRAAANTLGALAQRGGLPDDATAVVIEARGVTQAIRSNVPHAQAARQLGAQN